MQSDMEIEVMRDPNQIRFSRQCSVTGEFFGITISEEQFVKWKINKESLLVVMPELDKFEREFLISGYTPAEWSQMFEGGDWK